jgi:hypothetical protein
LAEIFEPTEPFPVDVELKLAESDFQITGTIENLLDAKGMDLRLSGDVAELSRLVSFFGMDVPPLGQLALRARVTGDASAPALSEFSLRLSGAEQVDVSAAGFVANLLTGEGASIDFSGECTHEEALQALVSDSVPAMTKFAAQGTIRDVEGDLAIRIEDAHGRTRDDITINTTGAIILNDPRSLKEMNVQVKATAPNTEVVKPYLFDFLPASGPVTAEAVLAGTNKSLALENITARAEGGADLVDIDIEGRIGIIPLNEDPIADMDIAVSIASKASALVSTPLDIPLPELGAITVRTQVRGSTDEFSLDTFSLQAQHPQGLTSNVSGRVRFVDREQDDYLGYLDLQTAFSAPSMAAMTPVLGTEILPFLAPVQAQGRLKGTTDALTIEKMVVKLGHGGPLTFECKGDISRIPLIDEAPMSGLDIRASISASNSADLSHLLGRPIPDIGPLTGTGRIVSRKGSLSVNDLTVVVDSGEEFHIKATGGIDSLDLDDDIPFEGINAKITASGEEVNALTSLVGLPFPDFGPFETEADFSYRNGYIVVKNLMLSATGQEGQALLVEAKGETEPKLNRSTVSVTFVTSTKPLVDPFLDRPVTESHTVNGSAQVTFTPENISVKKFSRNYRNKRRVLRNGYNCFL